MLLAWCALLRHTVKGCQRSALPCPARGAFILNPFPGTLLSLDLLCNPMASYPVNDFQTDFRAEVVGAELLELTNGLSGITIERLPALERPHSKDIRGLHVAPAAGDGGPHWRITTPREGLYESLPENIFHEPTLGSIHASEEEIIHRIRKHRKQEAEARQFFAPFEQEIAYLNVQMYALEKAVCRTHSDDIIAVFARLWPFLQTIDPQSARVFIHILPFLHRVKGDPRWTEAYLALFTGVPVRISEYPRALEPADDGLYALGGQALGEGFVLYGPAHDGEMDLEIAIGPVPWERTADFLPGAPLGKILDELFQHFLPFHQGHRTVLLSPEEGRTFALGSGADHAALGYSVFLS